MSARARVRATYLAPGSYTDRGAIPFDKVKSGWAVLSQRYGPQGAELSGSVYTHEVHGQTVRAAYCGDRCRSLRRGQLISWQRPPEREACPPVAR